MRTAVAAIFTVQGEVFSILRQTTLSAFPGFTAFPGGKVDEGDEQLTYTHPLLMAFPALEIGALIREIREELGFDIKSAIEQQQIRSISQFGSAITPTHHQHCFEIHFYKIELASRPTFQLKADEVAAGHWETPNDLKQRYLQGHAMMVNSTLNITNALAHDIQAPTASIDSGFTPDSDSLMLLPFIHGVNIIFVHSQTLPPATTTNALLIGDHDAPHILTDPSPKSERVLTELTQLLTTHKPDAILLSHHHPDHHERAPQLARELNIPILCSAKCQQRLRQRFGDGYLDRVTVRVIKQGDVITQWQGQAVTCHELPGHDDTMIGLAPDSLAWFYVADLVEPGTTVVIPEPEGDMAVYFDSLERVIAMQPRHIIPSHGLPVLGTDLLSQTLAHRTKREQQILDAYNEGLRDEALLQALYPELAEKLIPYAAQNIRQHLRKLGLYLEN